ncbi:helix-turn-helix transcriptional regulator [Stenotrophomonas mori]|uniref:LuxR C-terminal-related transcriptional regulator n=1 Tax=Stenotrophomonas mori TaxID=2871096 RepID=A0ABT0SDK2_9GAMM|nr:LuxR C-terminal-related transcriptional regulator [Stenotrophomonas mori]MCL7713410.1 LuxR C-terminal-related transcriptional regulator [Stenotrophomonas mori]
MLMLDATSAATVADPLAAERAAVVKALDMGTLWQACTALINKALPCHSCSLLFDIDGYQPLQGRHHLAEAGDDPARLVTSLEVAAPYLDANPQIRSYTFSQIALQDAHAPQRLKAQNPSPGWREFIHLAFWQDTRLEAVLSIRILTAHTDLSDAELGFLAELHPLLDASLQRVRMLESDRMRHKAVEDLLYELPLAAVLVDQDLVPSYMSREAKRLCRRWSADAERQARLPRAIEVPLRHWMESADEAAAPGQRASFAIAHPQRAGEGLRVEISSAPGNSFRHAQHLLILAPEGEQQHLIDVTSARALPALQCLSPSERKVAGLVASGLSNDAIAERLCRSRKTIESQISSIFRKLNVANRTQLARLLT